MTACETTTARPTAVLAGVAGRLKAEPMLRSSAFIMATTVVASLLGYAFWLAVARTFAPEVTGQGSATTSALQGAALFASVGSAAAMIEWLPKCTTAREWRQPWEHGASTAPVTRPNRIRSTSLLYGFATTWNSLPASTAPPPMSRPCVAVSTRWSMRRACSTHVARRPSEGFLRDPSGDRCGGPGTCRCPLRTRNRK